MVLSTYSVDNYQFLEVLKLPLQVRVKVALMQTSFLERHFVQSFALIPKWQYFQAFARND